MCQLREERNTNLDQLTAILQFIHKPKCCARLYPTPLAEIVQPFSSDYFLYWGAVGSPRGQYRILWFLSRNVLPVSAQQVVYLRFRPNPVENIGTVFRTKCYYLFVLKICYLDPHMVLWCLLILTFELSVSVQRGKVQQKLPLSMISCYLICLAIF